MNIPPDEQDLHAYVDGRLDADARVAVERWLALHPARAEQVRRWRQDAQQLRAALDSAAMPAATATLDPAALRARRTERARARLAVAASFVLCVALGAMGGWQAHGWSSAPAAPMSDAVAAYKLMVVDRSARVDVVQKQPGELQAWVAREIGAPVRLPDLSGAGFAPVGGRLFATERGAAAMVLYEDAAGRTLSFYIRPPESANRLLAAGERADGALLARYGSVRGFNYAVVGRADSVGEAAVARALDEQI
ncbi:anti-sigma factor [Burkholderia thailandensis]|uniref:anti-sigma factor family protein n=3 Tax=Burkholderia thailandensis TaxID=57975 RepID=UPI000CC86DEF|nr:anti-sigma factor [Burkholderia thailandensis]MCS3390608.1 anti-sigma factor [Burkholderia thailandensis]MCS6424495.1 anti-sigma factor [Burkholderia thailandensis]MCS6451722.1 anti-sigma factor [Burkholderia thailandensis]MCS6463809.1 anti-sigma factor [Burkholderia thailandensis]MCS6481644.1 anti-sigma factor [Burkholderia thailandensis]